MTEIVESLADTLPYSVVMVPQDRYESLVSRDTKDPYIPLPEGVATVSVVWNGPVNLNVYYRSEAGGRTHPIGYCTATSTWKMSRTVLTVSGSDGARLHLSTATRNVFAENTNKEIYALVQIFPTLKHA